VSSIDPVLQSIIRAAMDASAAAHGWLLALDGETLRVVAAAGGDAGRLIGAMLPARAGTAGYVVASGQPLAMARRAGNPRFAEGMASLLERPPDSVMSVPCSTEEAVLGVLELADKAGGGTFSFDDLELATLLASVAGASLAHVAPTPAVPDAAQLGWELQRLAATDPTRYAAVATAVSALLARE
jgi:sigma-B regulation protein RsbU (phosphoserine phosphatase)